MKVLFNCQAPFMLVHGGGQIQIEQTMAALTKLGVFVEPLRWWDAAQSGEVLHYFGRMPNHLLRAAQQKGFKVVVSELLTEQGSRSPARIKLQRFLRWAMVRALPSRRVELFSWDSYRLADANVVLTGWEARLLKELYDAPPEKTHVVPNGVEEVFFQSPPAQRSQWLVCTATITERKRVLELGEAAVRAKTPLWVIGKPYSEADPYAQRFLALAKAHPEVLRYAGPLQDRPALARAYREARGFVLLSAMESLSLSALEAAACECPLLLSRLPWAATVFGENACYCPITPSPARAAGFLRQFYDAAPGLPPPPKPLSWQGVGQQLKGIYETVLSPT